jgi:hypothetical protein
VDIGGKCRSATEGGPRTARPYLPVSLQPKRQTRELVPLPESARRSTNSMSQRPAPPAVRFSNGRRPRVATSRMTTTAVFLFDVAARDCMRSYHLSGWRDCADGTRPPIVGNSKRNGVGAPVLPRLRWPWSRCGAAPGIPRPILVGVGGLVARGAAALLRLARAAPSARSRLA